MYLVRIGWRTINLEFLVETADSALGAPPNEASPGMLRVSMYPGKAFEIDGDDAGRLRLHLDDNLRPNPPGNSHPPAKPKGARARTVPSPSRSKLTDE